MKRILVLFGLFAIVPAFGANEAFNTFVSGLSAASSLAGSELFPCIQSGATKSCTPAQIKTYLGAVTDGSGTTTANELLLSSTTAHAYTNAVTLPTVALPALGGDVTSSAGSNSVTVSKVNGASVPASALVAGTDTGSHIIAETQGANTILCNATSSTANPTACSAQAAIGVLNSTAANAQTGTTYTPVTGDANGEVTMSNASANTYCLPPNSSVAYAVGTLLTVQEVSTGVTTIAPAGTLGCAGTGVTITSPAYGSSTTQTYSLGGIYGFIQLQQTTTNTWTVIEWDTPASGKINTIGSEMQAYLTASTQFTYSAVGCTPSASSGGPFAGKITLAAGPCSHITVTLNGATGFTDTNGYACAVTDATTTAEFLDNPTNGALTQTSGGTIAATTYYVRSTWVNANGETLGATETSLAVSANFVLNVAAPGSPPAGATGWNVYVSTATGTETKQNTSAIATGTAWVEPTTGLIAGAALPASNTTGYFIPTWSESSSTSTTATFPVLPVVGATDSLSFACHPRSL